MKRYIIGLVFSASVIGPVQAQIPVTDVIRNISAEIHNTLEKAHWVSELAKMAEMVNQGMEVVSAVQQTYSEAIQIKNQVTRTVDALSGERPWATIRNTILDQMGREYLPESWEDLVAIIESGTSGNSAWDIFVDVAKEIEERYGLPDRDEVFIHYPDDPQAEFYGQSRSEGILAQGLSRLEYEKSGEAIGTLNDLMTAGRKTADIKDSLDYLGRMTAFNTEQAIALRRSTSSLAMLLSQEATREGIAKAEGARMFHYDEDLIPD